MHTLTRSIVEAVGSITKGAAPLHAPEIGGEEWTYVKECLDTGWVSSVGSYVDLFEARLAEYTGVAHAVVTSSGTAALHVSLLLAGVQAGDEVLVPTLTFAATANAVAYCGAVPHFCDSSEHTLGIDPARLEQYLATIADQSGEHCINRNTGNRIAGVVCMHTYGHAVELDALAGVCGRFGIPLIEDAAESLGSFYKGKHTGASGLVSALSFNGNKIVTTGGGGALLTNDPDIAARAKHLTTTAKVPHKWEFTHDQVGFNYRMPNINAAMGCAQLERLPDFIHRKRSLAAAYTRAFDGIDGVRFYAEPDNCQSNYWLNVLLLEEDSIELRDEVLTGLNEAGYMSRPAWLPNHQLEMYDDAPCDALPVAESLYRRLINIPSSPCLA